LQSPTLLRRNGGWKSGEYLIVEDADYATSLIHIMPTVGVEFPQQIVVWDSKSKILVGYSSPLFLGVRFPLANTTDLLVNESNTWETLFNQVVNCGYDRGYRQFEVAFAPGVGSNHVQKQSYEQYDGDRKAKPAETKPYKPPVVLYTKPQGPPTKTGHEYSYYYDGDRIKQLAKPRQWLEDVQGGDNKHGFSSPKDKSEPVHTAPGEKYDPSY